MNDLIFWSIISVGLVVLVLVVRAKIKRKIKGL